MENNLSRKVYLTWDEAFKALLPVVRQQSVRVASYTQVLFAQACASNFGKHTKAGSIRMHGKNADLVYKCALYHQIGKSLVPHEYQVWNKNFSDEEKALYRKYTSDGRILVAKLQEQTIKNKVFNKEFVEEPTDNIAWLMIRETCQQHMERYDGLGYPQGLNGDEISPIAQIVGLAKELDRLCSEVKSETPFEDAMFKLSAMADKAFSKELIEVLKGCRGKLRAVYRKYIQYTKTIPTTIPLVEKRKDRPMGLKYRPMVRGRDGYIVAYEAVAWFKGSKDTAGETQSMEEVEEVLSRTKLTDDMMFYFLYEVADTVLRMQNCKLPVESILLPVYKEFYTSGNKMNRLVQLFEDQPIDMRLLALTLPQEVLINPDRSTIEFVDQMMDLGIPLVLDNYRPNEVSLDLIRELGISAIRFASDLYLQQETANLMNELKNEGFQLIGSHADTHDVIDWLDASGVSFSSGSLMGELVDEETLIKDLLLKEQEDE